MEAVTEGPRVWAERQLENKLARRFVRIQEQVIRLLQSSGVARQLEIVGRPIRDRKLADEVTQALFQEVHDQAEDFEARHQIAYNLRVGHYRMFEYGNVVALNLMGFPATSRRVTDMERESGKVNVRKSASVRFELEDQAVIDAIENRVVVASSLATSQAVEATRRLVRDMVILAGLSTQDVADSLAITEGFPQWYANKLARTEMHQAYELAQHEQFVKSGVKFHSWLTVGDRRVRPQHVDNEAAGPIRIGLAFPSGQRHPGEGALSVNCRCTITPDLSDPTILLEPWDGRSIGSLNISPMPATAL